MNAPDCESVPLESIRRAPIIGWRCWFVYEDELTLRPIYRRGLAWKPREAKQAICPNEAHDVPETGCKCGIWTVRDPKDLREVHWTTDPPKDVEPLPGVLVVGQVALWGDMIEHERGWRAAYGYPTHLYLFSDDAERAAALRDRYLVPVEHGERAEALRARLPKPAVPASTSASAPAPPSKPTLRRPSGALKRVIDSLPAGPLRQEAGRRLEEIRWRLDEVTRTIEQARETLRTSAGGHVFRAAQGDVTAARRITWALVAQRWREAKRTHELVLKAEPLAERTTHLRTGEPLAPTTLAQRKATVQGARADLDRKLRDLAETPTPSYREWRAVSGGR